MNNKAFTLVELLAVIIILCALSVLIIPKVTNMLKEAEKSTYITSVEGIVKSATYQYSNNDVVGKINENITIDYGKGINKNYLDYNGKIPESGIVNIKKNGDVAVSVKYNDYCYIKKYTEDTINVIEYNENTCGINSDIFINYELPDLVTIGDGLYESSIDEGRYVYKGTNPDNYIWLDESGDNIKTDDELYRIISYEEDGMIKVIRNESIGTFAWDYKNIETDELRNNENNTFCIYETYYGCNAWGNQNNTSLNGAILSNLFYYNYYLDNATHILTSSNSGTVINDSSMNHYLNNIWLNSLSGISNYIANYNFNVGGLYYYNGYTGGDKGIRREKEETKFSLWNGKIGLMSITDIVESSTDPSCTSVYSNYYNNKEYLGNQSTITWSCANSNWMKKNMQEWTITAFSRNNSNVWYVNTSGWFHNGTADKKYNIRPAFYLKSIVKLKGFGTYNNPYEIVA